MRGDDDLLVVDNGVLRLTFWPGCGGRLIGLEAAGVELLWRDPDYVDPIRGVIRPRCTWAPVDGTMASWVNVGGSKTWPAPQGWSRDDEWHGPPDAVLDSGVWEMGQVIEPEGTTVAMTSPPDARSGLQVTRTFRIPPGGTSFSQAVTFANISGSPVRWSIWEVCQADTSQPGARALVPVMDGGDPVVMLEVVGPLPTGEVIDGVCSIPVTDVVGKLGFPNGRGCVALRRDDGTTLELRTARVEGGVYPDGGNSVELWFQYPLKAPLADFSGLHPQARLVELEVLGPLTQLAPGEHTELHIEWTVTLPD